MPGPKIDPERYAEAEGLLAAGESFAEAARQTNIGVFNLYRKFPQYKRQRKDPTPGGGLWPPASDSEDSQTKRKARKVKPPGITDDKLVEFYSKVASAPAVPMLLWAKCEFCATHFNNTGPLAATQLVQMSKENASLRSVLEIGFNYFSQAMWAGVLAMYAGIPIAHHLAPDNIYNILAFFSILPAREEVNAFHQAHTAGPAQGGPADDPAAETPFGSLDLDQLFKMASGMGIQMDFDDMIATAQNIAEQLGQDDVIDVEANEVTQPDAADTTEHTEDAEPTEPAALTLTGQTVEAIEADTLAGFPPD